MLCDNNCDLEFVYKYFIIQNIEALVLLKKHNAFVIYRFSDLFGLLYLSAMHRICIPAGTIVLAAHAFS